MFAALFRSHSTCDYARFLKRYCPLPQFCEVKEEKSSSVTLTTLTSSYAPIDGVVSFLRAVLNAAFPPAFWGSTRNLSQVLHKVEDFVRLRRQEQLTNKLLMEGIKVTDLRWLWRDADRKSTKSDHEEATIRARFVMRWVFCRYLVPLLRSIFYITDSEFSAKTTLYYRKPVWSIFRSLSMKKLLASQYTEITRKEAIARIRKQDMGFSRLRISAQSFHKQQHCFRCLTGLTGVTRSVIIDEMNGEKALNALASSCDYQVRKEKPAPFIF
jgi:telomerase reverse transcriptase